MNDYSQYGEGKVINHYFNDFKGTLISLGENDGKTLSNVLGLIENGWNAHLVEPSKEAFSKLEALHKHNNKVHVYNYAVSDYSGETTFYHSGTHLNKGDVSLLSTLDKKEIDRWNGTCEFTEEKVNVKTFKDFLNDTKLSTFDFISIDCEGVDYKILKQIDLTALQVKMLCIEYNNVDEQMFTEYAKIHGFKLHYKNYCNLIFVK
jgi:FkbM family methyltransferase